MNDYWQPDTEALVAAGPTTHVVEHRLLVGAEEVFLDVATSRVSYDETRSPRGVATIVAKIPDDVALLSRADPRQPVRLSITAGYRRRDGLDDVQPFDSLVWREYDVSDVADELSGTAQSDECLLLDNGSGVFGTFTRTTTRIAIDQILTDALGTVTSGTTSNAGPAVTQETYYDRWDVLADYADRIDAQIWCSQGAWRIADTPQTAGPVSFTAATGAAGTISSSTTKVSRDDWANKVVVLYDWTDAANVPRRIVGTATVTTGPYAATVGNTKVLLVRREVPVTQAQANAAAAGILRRVVTRGAGYTFTAEALYWVRPGDTVQVGTQDLQIVQSVTFDLAAGTMEVATRLPDNTGSIT